MERRLIADDSRSVAVRTCTAILAGSKWSCCILKAVSLWPMDNVRKRLPELHLKVCIADLEGNLFGCQSSLITAAPGAAATLASALEWVYLRIFKGIV